MIEGGCEVPGEFKMLGLIFADGDVGGAIEEDVCGLKHRIGEKTQFERFMRFGVRVDVEGRSGGGRG